MKTSAFGITMALNALVGSAASQGIQVEVRYSKEMVDVGNLDIFKETWETIYATGGNQRSILADRTFETAGGECTAHADTADNKVRVTMDGQWGKVDGLGITESRDALIKSVYEVLNEVANPTGWNVFTNCWGTSWQEAVPKWEGPHACGGVGPTVSDQCFCGIGTAQCEFHSWGHRVPSLIKANMYREDKLLPDTLKIEFSSAKIEKDDGCGIVGDITRKLVGFLPGPTVLFNAGLDIVCSS